MTELLDTLVGMDPVGDGALLLCAIMAGALGVLLLVGFGIVRPRERSPRQGASTRPSRAVDLGLVALWRLNRSLQKSGRGQDGESPEVEPVSTSP